MTIRHFSATDRRVGIYDGRSDTDGGTTPLGATRGPATVEAVKAAIAARGAMPGRGAYGSRKARATFVQAALDAAGL